MVERIKLTDDDIEFGYVSDFGHKEMIIIKHPQLTNLEFEQLKKQIISDSEKIEKITQYAMKLVYANPAISWQLKQLLRNAPPKEVTYKVTCSKCDLDAKQYGKSLDEIKQHFENYKENNKAVLTCLHDYQYELIDQK